MGDNINAINGSEPKRMSVVTHLSLLLDEEIAQWARETSDAIDSGDKA